MLSILNSNIKIIKKLEDVIKSNLKGRFQKVVLSLMEPTLEYEVHCLKEALKDYVHNIHSVRVIVQILCTKTQNEIIQLSDAYHKSINIRFNFLF